MSKLAFESATSLADKIRNKQISAVDLLDHYLQRLDQHNPAVNAIIFTQIDKAKQRAQEADAALARNEIWGPLHGVPMTIKDSFDWIGSPTTWGNPKLAENFPAQNDVVVNRLQDAGAIIFGKSNIPLMLSDWQSFNDIYGTTSNPWNLDCVPGGSSGGSAAALAAGLTGLELGSDIGASIRNPAHYCGVYGHKPTYGIIPGGHMLEGTYAPADIAVSGPLARSAEDLALALDILAGSTGLDAAGWRLDLPPPAQKSLSEYKVAVMLTSQNCAQDDELTEQLQKTVDALARAGVQVDDAARPDIDLARAHHVYLMLLRAATGVELDDAAFGEYVSRMAQRAKDDWSYRAYVDRAVTLDHRAWWQLHNEREKMRLLWSDFFQEYDLLLCPTAASATYPHDHAGERPERTIPVNGGQEPTTDQLFWAGLSCCVYLPSTVAPAGLTRSGLPCGLQIVGNYLHDKTCIDFARLMGEELGGFVAPAGYE